MTSTFDSLFAKDLDETHLFIAAEALEQLKDQIDDLMDRLSVPVVDGQQK